MQEYMLSVGTIRMPSSSLLVKIMGHPLSQLPNYLKDGAACFLDVGTLTSGKLYFLFILSYRLVVSLVST